jgi:hypothetical protein
MTTSAVEKHAELVAAGWSCRLDGYWRPPPTGVTRASTRAAQKRSGSFMRNRAGPRSARSYLFMILEIADD